MSRVRVRRSCLARSVLALTAAGAVCSGAPHVARAADVLGTEASLEVTRSEGTEDCPGAVDLLAATLALGSDAADSSTDAPRITVHFARAGSGYTATIRSSGRKAGIRELARSEPACASLAEATAVVLALLFDLVPAEATALPAPKSLPLPSQPAASSARAEPGARVSRARGRWLALGVQGGASYGLLGPGVAGSVAGVLRPRLGRFELGLGGVLFPERSFSRGAGFVDVSLLSARLVGCGWLTTPERVLELGACGGLLVGRLRGRGRGFFRDLTAHETWGAASLGAAARLSIGGPWALRLEPSLVVPLREYVFSLADTGRAVQTARAALLLEAGVEVRFP